MLSQYCFVALTFLCLFFGQVCYPKNTESVIISAVSVVNQPPIITSDGTTFCAGSSLLLTSSEGLTYQWYKDNVEIQGAVNQTYNVTVSGVYKVFATFENGLEGTSPTVQITQVNKWTGAYADGDWNTASNWSCGVVPVATDYVEIAETSALYPVILNESSITIFSLTIAANAQLKIYSGSTLMVTDAIIIDATGGLVLQDGASIVQVNDVENSGNITAFRDTKPMKKYDFTYWSSPVSNQTLHNLSPNTMADKYYSFNPLTGGWVVHLNGNTEMQEGLGYIIRAPQGYSATIPQVYEAQFIGTPNNGRVEVPIAIGNSDMNLVGNPYPSALDVDAFLLNETNAALVGGTIYIWTHNSAPSQGTPGDNAYNYTSDDYSTYNLLGGVATSTFGNNERPDGKIASGQSFGIQAMAEGSVVFDNSMRVAAHNDQFFRAAQYSEKNRIWLNLSNAQGAFKQTLIGFMDQATAGVDRNFDGALRNGNSFVNFYSIINNQNFCIQGRGLPFDQMQSIPLGYSTTISGSFSISLGEFDGLFQGQDVYIFDRSDNSLHNLKNSAYQFTTTTGTFNNRFELRFTDTTLGTQLLSLNENGVNVCIKNHQVNIESPKMIKTVTIYDASGKEVFEKNGIKSSTYNTEDLTVRNQIIIVKIKNEQGYENTKIVMD
jgi:hypothetical protein